MAQGTSASPFASSEPPGGSGSLCWGLGAAEQCTGATASLRLSFQRKEISPTIPP